MPTIVHFDIASDDPQRAKKFYESLFDWEMAGPPGMTDYYLIETEDLKGNRGVGGGLGKRGEPSQRITSYIGVDNIEKFSNKVAELGGKVVQPKMTVPGWGYLSLCMDTEGNAFGLWQDDKDAGKKPTADNFVEMFRTFGEAIGQVFDDPELKRKSKEFADSAADSAKTLANRFKDEDVRAKFRDVGKAAEEFGKSVTDYFKKEKQE
jgi:predicted enzyme related to lactoylglutathione lyase